MGFKSPPGLPELSYENVSVDDPALVKLLGLGRTDAEREAFISANFKTEFIQRRKQPYPYSKYWSVESHTAYLDAYNKWTDRKSGILKLREPRNKKSRPLIDNPLAFLDPDLLRVVAQSESVIFRDAKTKALVFVVMRKVVKDQGIIEHIATNVKQAVEMRLGERVSLCLHEMCQDHH